MCARATADPDAPLVCCPWDPPAKHLYAFYYYCKNMPRSATCWSDAMCKSGKCDGNGGGGSRGKCL